MNGRQIYQQLHGMEVDIHKQDLAPEGLDDLRQVVRSLGALAINPDNV